MAVVTTQKQNVGRSDNFESHKYTIAATPQAFKILSDGLYSDKVGAVIRELGTNAIDAHIAAGSFKKPFNIHLPNLNEPYFRIRDFGTGMTHDEATRLYTTYFGSNKTNSNDYTGQLGLGSKSPLSYAKSFTVTVYKDGERRCYVSFINEDGLPDLNYLKDQTGPTTELDGVEIQIAVRRTDFDEYCRKAAQIYQYFDLKPVVTGNNNYKLPERQIVVEGKGWRILSGRATPKAVMGRIAYPIMAEKIHNLTEHARNVLQLTIEIDFPIGSIEFTPSRETLSYTRRTSATLLKRIEEIAVEVNERIAKMFEGAPSLWEARVLAYEMFWSGKSELSHLHKLADANKLTYNGQPIGGQQLHFEKIKGVQAWSFALKEKTLYYSDKVVSATVSRNERQYFMPKPKIKWCEIDIPRGSYARCQEIIRRKEAQEVYLVSFADQQAKKAFCEVMGLSGNEFVLTSTLPKPPVRRGTYHGSTSEVYKHKGYENSSRLYRYWEDATVDLDEGGVYVEMRHNQAYYNDAIVNPGVVGKIMSLLKELGHKVEVIGVRPSVAKAFRQSDDWVDIFSYAREVLRNETVNKDLAVHLANINSVDSFSHKRQLVGIRRFFKGDPDCPMKKFLDTVQTMEKSREKVKLPHLYNDLAEIVGYEKIKELATTDLDAEARNLLTRYPMLSVIFDHMSCYHAMSEREGEAIWEYIAAIDSLTAAKTGV